MATKSSCFKIKDILHLNGVFAHEYHVYQYTILTHHSETTRFLHLESCSFWEYIQPLNPSQPHHLGRIPLNPRCNMGCCWMTISTASFKRASSRGGPSHFKSTWDEQRYFCQRPKVYKTFVPSSLPLLS